MLKRILVLFVLIFNANPVIAACLEPVPNEYIVVTDNPEGVLSQTGVNFKTTPASSRYIYNHQKALSNFKTQTKLQSELTESTLLLTLDQKQLKAVKAMANVKISKNCFVEPLSLSNDSFEGEALFQLQWGLKSFLTDLNLADYNFSHRVVVAVSDTGFDLDHEDLNSNLWINERELSGRAGFDDDNNGCLDDIHGCDVTNQTGNNGLNNYKSNLLDHGSHVAGIIGSTTGNTKGIAGAGFNVELMLIKAFSSQRKTTVADLLKSVYYAVDNEADILNCSWGSGSMPTVAEFNAFEYARINGVAVVVAAGNNSTYASRMSPSGLTNVLTVGSHNSSFNLSTFSNFGGSVDIYAPGGDGVDRKNDSILSLGANSAYLQKKGTSMSAPFVAAALANLKSLYPSLTRNELLNLILKSGDVRPISGFYDENYKDDGVFLNLKKALDLADMYVQGQITEDFKLEPKNVVRPSSVNIFDEPLDQQNLGAEAQSSTGCMTSNLESNAQIYSWLFLLLPIVLLQIKKGL